MLPLRKLRHPMPNGTKAIRRTYIFTGYYARLCYENNYVSGQNVLISQQEQLPWTARSNLIGTWNSWIIRYVRVGRYPPWYFSYLKRKPALLNKSMSFILEVQSLRCRNFLFLALASNRFSFHSFGHVLQHLNAACPEYITWCLVVIRIHIHIRFDSNWNNPTTPEYGKLTSVVYSTHVIWLVEMMDAIHDGHRNGGWGRKCFPKFRYERTDTLFTRQVSVKKYINGPCVVHISVEHIRLLKTAETREHELTNPFRKLLCF